MPLPKWQYLLYIKALTGCTAAPNQQCLQLLEQARENLQTLYNDFAQQLHRNKWLADIHEKKYTEYFLSGNNRIKLRTFSQLFLTDFNFCLYSDDDLAHLIFDRIKIVTPGVHYWRHGSYGTGQFCSNDIDIVVYTDMDTPFGSTVLEQMWLRSPANVLSLVSNRLKCLFTTTCEMLIEPDVMIAIYSSLQRRVMHGTHGLVDECNNASIHTVPHHITNHCATFKNLPAPQCVPGDLIDWVPRDISAALRKTFASLSVLTRVKDPYRGIFKYVVNQIRDTNDIASIIDLLATIDFTQICFQNTLDISVGYRLKKVAVTIVQWMALAGYASNGSGAISEELYTKSEYYNWAKEYPAVQKAIVRDLVTDCADDDTYICILSDYKLYISKKDWEEFARFFSDFLNCARQFVI